MNKYIDRFRKKIGGMTHKKRVKIPPNELFITFTFDDIHQSALNEARKMLNKHNIKATYYVCLSFLKSEDAQLKFDLDDLKKCAQDGHELACHTYSHLHFLRTERNEILRDLDLNKAILKRILPGINFNNFSYPFGEQTSTARRIIKDRFTSGRGIEQGINRGIVDLNNLKAVRLYEKTHSIAQIESILRDARDKGGWLVFYTHDVQDDFSKYGCSPEYFEKILKLVLSKSIQPSTITNTIETITMP
ncbi:MAG: peptidoglycan/xylan/chitin deacetylase (PgdA/CDA1 family) [Cyclobacteriaceae bacterium]|jgi:peptidoglycan/xylan/chitin deacetylase (PgdA/CDA1 family)